ncbi:MAG TPA: hypothetical protein DCY03_25945 [Planctomycetaceae bacterium]|nr:hypothetical protein [Planctomycetaceae bacterium]|tara:strand:+ start:7389 stop:8402 length:1014 start_codon:yes stop_codon:yes gene_type:complete
MREALPIMRNQNLLIINSLSCFISILMFTGCSHEASPDKTAQDTTPDPPVPTAPAGPVVLTEQDIHERLKKNNPDYQNNAEFGKQKGEIISAKLVGVEDISALKGMKLQFLDLMNCPVSDLRPLKGMDLQYLDLTHCPVTDLSPLKGMKIQELYLEGSFVSDLSPLQGMPIRILRMEHTPVSDISPLEGMPLNQLNLFDTKVKNLGLINTLPLKTLWIPNTEITDISPLKGMLLESLDIQDTKVADLSPLRGMQFLRLNLANSAVTDLTPLKGMPLQRLIFTPANITKGMDVIRDNPSIQGLGASFDTVKAAEEFWKEYDAAQMKPEKENPEKQKTE